MNRQDVVNKAKSLLGIKYAHQGRSEKGLDCVGVLAMVADEFNYVYTDLEGYKRTPSASALIDLLKLNLDEIELSETEIGDIYLMRLGQGIKPRHTSIKVSDSTIIHALNMGNIQRVIEQPLDQYRGHLVKAFRFRGICD